MKFLWWLSMFFFTVGSISIIIGLGNEDVWVIGLGTILFCGSNMFEIIRNREMIRNLNKEV